jgi:hypothetical protein
MEQAMRGKRRVAIVLLTTVALTVLGGGLWYIVHLSSGDQPPRPLRWEQNARLDRGFRLISVPQGPGSKAPPLEEVWRNLFQDMSKDPETKKLIAHLLGEAPYQFVALDADEKAAEEALPKIPPAEHIIILGVRVHPTWSERWRHSDGTRPAVLRVGPETPEADKYVRCVDVGLTLAYLEHSPSGKVRVNNVQILAANEYLLRHRLGCLLCTELTTDADTFRAVVGSTEGARAYHDREIDEYLTTRHLPPLPK